MLLINTFGQDSLSGLLFKFKRLFPHTIMFMFYLHTVVLEIPQFLKLYRTDIVHIFFKVVLVTHFLIQKWKK